MEVCMDCGSGFGSWAHLWNRWLCSNCRYYRDLLDSHR